MRDAWRMDTDHLKEHAYLGPTAWRVLRMLARGWSNSAIAEDLGVGQKTVENYTNEIYDALGVKTSRRRSVRVLAARRYWRQQGR